MILMYNQGWGTLDLNDFIICHQSFGMSLGNMRTVKHNEKQ